jgi:hypothetical protein
MMLKRISAAMAKAIATAIRSMLMRLCEVFGVAIGVLDSAGFSLSVEECQGAKQNPRRLVSADTWVPEIL